jgi:hypothetical protein
MGVVLSQQGRNAEAVTHYERSLAIRLKVHGTEEHPEVARTSHNLQSLHDLMSASSAMQRLNVDTTAGTFTNAAATEELRKGE